MENIQLVNRNKQVVDNIKRFNAEVKTQSDGRNKSSIDTLVNNIPHYRAWYCYYDKKAKKYLFAPSKYIGYENMNADIYYKQNSFGLDGRKTESVLANWYEQISSGNPIYDLLCEALRVFCSTYDKTPNSLFRINVVLDKESVDSIEDDVVELIWKIYLGLSKSNKEVLKTKINKSKK